MNLYEQEQELLTKLIKSTDKQQQAAIKRTISRLNEEMEKKEQ